jgi:dTDP-4-dehydrorhamnose reductase
MKLLVFGKTGQVAQELARRRPEHVEVRFVDRIEADLSRPEDCANVVASASVDAVIIVAAWTAVDAAETAENKATVINGAAPGAIARACAAKNIPILHLSTDYVFSGAGEVAFMPDDPTSPMTAYGRSKLAGEDAIRANCAHHLILRTSWVVSAHGTNFVKTMLRLGAERDTLKVVADQIGGPTPAAAIADALFGAARSLGQGHTGGTYHFAGAPVVSWADFAKEIMALAQLPCRIEGIASSEYPTRAQRPLNSRLDCTSFEQEFNMSRPDWQAGLKAIIGELGVAT